MYKVLRTFKYKRRRRRTAHNVPFLPVSTESTGTTSIESHGCEVLICTEKSHYGTSPVGHPDFNSSFFPHLWENYSTIVTYTVRKRQKMEYSIDEPIAIIFDAVEDLVKLGN